MAFPTAFPEQALGVLLTAKEHTKDRVALAVYDLVGYGLYKVFGDTKYLMQADPLVLAKLAVLLSKLPYDKLSKIVDRFNGLRTEGASYWRIAFTLVKEFGPVVLEVVEILMKG